MSHNTTAKRLSVKQFFSYYMEFQEKYKWIKAPMNFNMESESVLRNSPTFKDEMAARRKELKIPNLNPRTDRTDFPFGIEGEFTDSQWVQSYGRQDKINNAVISILEEFELSYDFYEFAEYYLLYNKFPKFDPCHAFNISQFHSTIESRKSAERLPLTTKELQFFKFVAHKVMGAARGRPNKKIASAFREWERALVKKKNKKRGMKNLEKKLKTFNVGKEIDLIPEAKKVLDYENGEPLSWAQLVYVFHHDDEEDRESAHLQRYKKQNQRLKTRYPKLFDK